MRWLLCLLDRLALWASRRYPRAAAPPEPEIAGEVTASGCLVCAERGDLIDVQHLGRLCHGCAAYTTWRGRL